MRILITGLGGFTGRYVENVLQAQGHEVFGLTADLTDPQALKRDVESIQPDAVIHLAGISSIDHGDVNAFYQVNLIGVRNLLDALAGQKKPLHRVLLVSSANVYGNRAEGIIDESAPPAPANDYGVSKLAMEYMARLWIPKLPIVILRPFNYTGVGHAACFVIPKLVAHFARKAESIELGNLNVEREFNDVRTVGEIYFRLLQKGEPGQVYNICSGRPVSLRTVIDELKRITGHDLTVNVNPAFVRANEVHRLCGNPAKLEACIGKLEFPLLEETLSWMLSESK